MRIAVDIQGIQSEGSRTRGIGRYSLEIIKNIIIEYPQDEIILVANASLRDVRSEFKKYLKNRNLTYVEWYSPAPYDYMSMDKLKTKLAVYLRSYAFGCLHADIILITSFFEGFSDNCCVEFDYDFIDIPIVSIFYDLIPLINPNLYLTGNPDFNKYYKSKIKAMKKLDGLLAISDSSSKEAIKYLRFNPNKIFNISSACDQKTFNTTSEIKPSSKINVDAYSPFILYSGASDPRKNIKSLLHAYSQLPSELSKYKLVLVGKLLIPEIELLNEWINLFNIDKKLIIQTGYISDIDLVELFRKCSLFVFPSLHEGFGLPVLEAMSCGAPVIGSNTTSIPEVLGLTTAMFDPTNIDQIQCLIVKALTNKNFNDSLRSNSLSQSKKFSWSKTSSAAFSACSYIGKSKKSKSYFLDWAFIEKQNKSQLKLLIEKMKSMRLFRRIRDDKFYSQVAASIDKTTSQIDSLARYVTSKEDIVSWKVEGPFDSSYSLSILNRSFVEALFKKINQVSIHITEGFGDYEPNIEYISQYPVLNSIFKASKKLTSFSTIISRNLYPPRVKDMNAKFNILHSYGWEESEFPYQWVDDFNSYLQGITVMSVQVKKILIDNGVRVPIRVCGLGLDHLTKVKSSSDFTIKAKGYKILHISSCFPRKGIDILLKAYADKFNINDDVSLIIKTFDNPHNDVDLMLNELRNTYPLFPEVLIIKDELSDEQLKSLYLQADLLVAPSRGEGFGLPIAEAMLLGVPVITTNWGGQLDFCNNSNSWLIDYDFVSSKSHFKLPLSYWAEPSLRELSDKLFEVYNSSPLDIHKKIICAKEFAKTLTWDRVAHENLSFSKNDLCNFGNRLLKIGWVSTWYEKCGIASYSRNLIDSIPDEIIIFSPFNEKTALKDERNVIPSWEYPYSRNQDFNNLLLKILDSNITSLIIQFNYSFFQFDEFSYFINKLKNENINIIIFLHSTLDPEGISNLQLKNLFSTFQKCNRILVHTINDLNRLKKIGLVNNVALFPHGVVDFFSTVDETEAYSKTPNSKNHIRIASYGFCLPNKGFVELIKAIKLLKDSNINIELNLYTSIYNDDYYWCYEELVDLIISLELGEFVSITNKYFPHDLILEKLSQHDLIVFPYQKSKESSSASVRDGVATLKPVLVTPLAIFDDISHCVEYFPGISPQDLANGILSWYEKNIDQGKTVSNDNEAKLKLIENLRFSKLGNRLYSIIQSLEINNF